MSDWVIEAADIRKSYTSGGVTTPVLAGIDLEVSSGECVFLAGPSGSGKSTLLSILGCILSADAGSLALFGDNVTGLGTKERARFRRERIGFVFQCFHLVSGLRAWENVKVPLDLLGWAAAPARAECYRLLDLVGMENLAERHIHQLSLGQRQRVAIARALAADPELILADEPTASLDFDSGQKAMKLLHDLVKQLGKTAVVVTHDPRIYHLADRILLIEDGRILGMKPTSNEPASRRVG